MVVNYFNPAAERMLKRKAAEVIGHRLFDVFPELQGSIFGKNFAQCIGTKTARSFEVELAVAPDENWYAMRLYPEANGIAVFSHVITERKQAEAALRESESQFRQLAESLPQPVWMCLPDGRCDYLNRQWIEFTGVPNAEQMDFGWLAQVHPDDRSGLLAAWKTAAAAGEPFKVEFRVHHYSGDYHWFDMRAAALRDAAGKIVKWFGMNINITGRKPQDRTESKAEGPPAENAGTP